MARYNNLADLFQALTILALLCAFAGIVAVLAVIASDIWEQTWFWVERCGWMGPP